MDELHAAMQETNRFGRTESWNRGTIVTLGLPETALLSVRCGTMREERTGLTKP
jgi:hypothetical protein